MRALVLQHVEAEPCGHIGDALLRHGVALDVVHLHRGDVVPKAIDGHAALVVMGGPMGVYEADQHPHLLDERALIQDAHRKDVPVLGVCLGSQLVASALGAKVAPSGGREIGWLEVHTSPAARDDHLFRHAPTSFAPWHWHGDVFELPAGAVALASSARTTHQSFRLARTWGILFHLEATRAIVDGMLATFGDDARAHGIDTRALALAADPALAALSPIATSVFDAFASLVVIGASEPDSPKR